MSEILLLDRNPLIPMQGDAAEDVVKQRFQQTKIEGAPDTIFVGADVVRIIVEQQHWLAGACAPTTRKMPICPICSYACTTTGWAALPLSPLPPQLRQLVAHCDFRDETGQPIPLSQTHRFRHTPPA